MTSAPDFNDVHPRVETYEIWKTGGGRWRLYAWDHEDERAHDSVSARSFPTMAAARAAAQKAWPKAIEVFL